MYFNNSTNPISSNSKSSNTPISDDRSSSQKSENSGFNRTLHAINNEQAEIGPETRPSQNISEMQFHKFSSTTASAEQREKIDWNATIVINEMYISELEKKISENYPKNSFTSYPKEDLSRAYLKNVKGNSYSFNAERNQRYNPFGLRLPYVLEGYEHLYDHTRVNYGDMRDTASRTYFNFIKQYNFAYLAFLKATTGHPEAIAHLKKLFTTEKMFDDAQVKKDYLCGAIASEKKNFSLALLGYLCMDIVRSPDQEISTAARVRSLKILKEHFDINAVASAFTQFPFATGFKIDEKEHVFDLIPRKFVTKPEESGGTPHNKLFLQNKKIQQLFQYENAKMYSQSQINFDSGLSNLLAKHPAETVQILLSLLRIDDRRYIYNKEFVFHALFNLAELDGAQKGIIFGIKASFRNGGISEGGLQDRVGGITGVGESFGDYLNADELNQMTPEHLKQRIRQMAYQQHLLESRIVELESVDAARFTNRQNDPKGYFLILEMRPDTSEENFDAVLKRNYRTLSLKHHPDKGGDAEKFKKILEAYTFLSSPRDREGYRSGNV